MSEIEQRLNEYVEVARAYLEPNYAAECGETLEQWLARRRAGDGPRMPMDPDRDVWTNLDDTYVTAAEHAAFGATMLNQLTDMRRERVRLSPFIGRLATETIPGEIVDLHDGGCVVEQVLTATVKETGAELRLPMCVIFFIRDGRIVRIHEYQDRGINPQWAHGITTPAFHLDG